MSSVPRELATLDYFNEEYLRFRAVMCSTRFTREQKERAFGGIVLVYLALNDTDEAKVALRFHALTDEFARRSSYEVFRLKPRA